MPTACIFLRRVCLRWRKTSYRSSSIVTPHSCAVGCTTKCRRARASWLLWVALLAPTLAVASEMSDSLVQFDISRQRADKALIEFAKQANLTFIFPVDAAQKEKANAIQGIYTAQAAIVLLLEGTRLRSQVQANGALTISAEEQLTDKGV